jgi:hypothetical protein
MAKTEMSVLKLVWGASLIVSSWVMTGVQAELYTCLADMEELLETEALLMRTLDGYIQAQEEKLHVLKRLVNVPSCHVGFEVFTAVTMKTTIFLDVTPVGSCKNRRFGGTYFFTARFGC